MQVRLIDPILVVFRAWASAHVRPLGGGGGESGCWLGLDWIGNPMDWIDGALPVGGVGFLASGLVIDDHRSQTLEQ